MSLLSPILSSNGWIYGQDSFVDKIEPLLVTPLYYPDTQGDRYFNGRPYKKYVKVGAKSDQPIPALVPFINIAPSTYVLPREKVVKIFATHDAYAEWADTNDIRRSTIQAILSKAAVPNQNVGLAGSKACDCTKPDSDIDVLIKGMKYVPSVLRELQLAIDTRAAQLMGTKKAAKYAQRYGEYYNMDQEHLSHLFATDVTKVYVEGKKISFIFVYDENEKGYIPKELYSASKDNQDIKIQATITSADRSWLYPRCYSLKTENGSEYDLWSHQWIHKNLFPVGTKVIVTAQQCSADILSLSSKAHKVTTY